MNTSSQGSRNQNEIWCCCVLLAASLKFIAAAQCPVYQTPGPGVTVASLVLNEISGLAVSRSQPVFWVHNDSGDTARVFALFPSGAVIGEYLLSGATNVDWEDMAIGPGPIPGVDYLYLGDIGDNNNNRPEIQVYRVAEPAVPPGGFLTEPQLLGDVQTIRLTYPDGPRDSETLMVDINGDIYVVSKRVTPRGRVYRAAYPQSTDAPSVLEFVAEIPWGSTSGLSGATGGDISPDGSAIIIRRSTSANPSATFWRRPPGTTIGAVLATAGCNLTLRSELQGEAAAFAPCGWTFFTVSEGAAPPLFTYRPSPSTAPPLGDADCSGSLNFDDIACFTAALVSPAAWEACGHAAGCRYLCANDVNRDGRVNFDDISPFVDALVGG